MWAESGEAGNYSAFLPGDQGIPINLGPPIDG